MEKKSRGMGLGRVLLVVFIILKLTNLIHWSWVWVLSLLWINAALLIVLLCLMALARR